MLKSWSKIAGRLKRLVADIGPLWPEPSTPIAGYAETGPYHCEDCIYLKGRKKGEDQIFLDEDGKGRCSHPMMLLDPRTIKDKKMVPIVNIERGCCEFVDNKGLEESDEEAKQEENEIKK